MWGIKLLDTYCVSVYYVGQAISSSRAFRRGDPDYAKPKSLAGWRNAVSVLICAWIATRGKRVRNDANFKIYEKIMKYIHNPHVGEILKSEFIDEIGMSQNDLARSIGVPPNRIHLIIKGARSVTADTDVRLCKFFGLSDGYFLRLQDAHNIMEVKRHKQADIDKIIPYILTKPCP